MIGGIVKSGRIRGLVVDGVRSRASERDQLPIGRIGRRLLESGSARTECMRRYPRKPHHHTSQIRYALNLSNLLLLINHPPPTGRLEHLSYTENRVLRQLTLRAPFPQVPILSLELTPRTLSTITSPIFSKFVLELGKKTSFPIHSAFLETLGPLGPDRQASSRIDLPWSATNSGSLSERENRTTGEGGRSKPTRRSAFRFRRGGVVFYLKPLSFA